jgi:hypothetical protein
MFPYWFPNQPQGWGQQLMDYWLPSLLGMGTRPYQSFFLYYFTFPACLPFSSPLLTTVVESWTRRRQGGRVEGRGDVEKGEGRRKSH